jgi:hypothetical protein
MHFGLNDVTLVFVFCFYFFNNRTNKGIDTLAYIRNWGDYEMTVFCGAL